MTQFFKPFSKYGKSRVKRIPWKMEDDYWKMGDLSLETYTSAGEVDDEADSKNDLLQSIHFDAKVARCERVIETLEHQLSLATNKSPFSIESYRYVEPTTGSTTRDVTDFSFKVVLHCNVNSNLLNYLHDILNENSKHAGICPSSINIDKSENVIRFRFLGDDGFLMNLCLAPAETFISCTGETQVQGQNS